MPHDVSTNIHVKNDVFFLFFSYRADEESIFGNFRFVMLFPNAMSKKDILTFKDVIYVQKMAVVPLFNAQIHIIFEKANMSRGYIFLDFWIYYAFSQCNVPKRHPYL